MEYNPLIICVWAWTHTFLHILNIGIDYKIPLNIIEPCHIDHGRKL